MRLTDFFRKSTPCSPPEKKTENIQARCQILRLESRDYLNIDLYWRGELKARYFADKHEKTKRTYINNTWKKCKISTAAKYCRYGMDVCLSPYDDYDRSIWKYATDEDRSIAETYLGGSIIRFQDDIGASEYKRTLRRRHERIMKEMERIPPVPDGMVRWLESLNPDRMLMVKTEEGIEYSCTACGQTGRKEKAWKQGEMITCPLCGKSVKTYRGSKKTEKIPVVLIQAYTDKRELEIGGVKIQTPAVRWIERQFVATYIYDYGETGEAILSERIQRIMTEERKTEKMFYNSDAGWWDANRENLRFMKSYLYPGNLAESLPDWTRGRGLEIMADHGRKINVDNFITYITSYPRIEYLIKMGMYRLAEEKLDSIWDVDMTGDNVKSVMKINGNRINRLKQMDGGITALKWLRYEEEQEKAGKKEKISDESLKWLEARRIRPENCEKMLKILSVNKIVNYMIRQQMPAKTMLTTWRDYLAMAQTEGMDITDDIVCRPKNLKERHDRMVERRNEILDNQKLEKEKEKYSVLDAGIREFLPEAQKYIWEDEEYRIIPAECCKELMKEGRALHHCVGASDVYMDKMAKGRTWILFLRRQETPETPYYTIEIDIKNDQIMQWYSEFDRKPDKEKIEAVLDKFRKDLRKRNRIRARTS